jgi:hypothetical protein
LTGVLFSFRPHDVSAFTTFLLTLAVVIGLALTYLVLHLGIRPSRWAPLFGLDERRRGRSAGDARRWPQKRRSR